MSPYCSRKISEITEGCDFEQSIFVTLDTDWAPDPVIRYALKKLREKNIKATIFATHASEAVFEILNDTQFEVGIHPNFNPLLEGKTQVDSKEVVEKLLEIYPASVSVRSHSLTESSKLLQLFRSLGLKFDCNTFIPWTADMTPCPWLLDNGIWKVPHFWEDDLFFTEDAEGVKIAAQSNKKLKVYVFHPVHIYLNTDSAAHYLRCKKHYHAPDYLWALRSNCFDGSERKFEKVLSLAS
jgi:peptidoglycan/xylan/chitin deacetylase (PgdA/CDA1 family)